MRILRHLWTEEESEPEVRKTYQYLFELRDKLEVYVEDSKGGARAITDKAILIENQGEEVCGRRFCAAATTNR